MAITEDKTGGLQQVREATVVEHIESELRRDFDATLATFRRPRYELPGGEVIDGRDAVADMYRELFTGFPNLRLPDFEPGDFAHHRDLVIGRSRMCGTHTGSFRGLPPTGRTIDVPMVVIFEFDGSELICERLYFDRLEMFVQLGVAREPSTVAGKLTTFLNHPLTLVRALLRTRRRRVSRAEP